MICYQYTIQAKKAQQKQTWKAGRSMELSKMIDHTLLKPDATQEDVRRICGEAKTYGFASVCVNSCYAALVREELHGSGVKTCCVVGFPLGAMSAAAKAFEAEQACADGAQEIDKVLNIGALKAGDDAYVLCDIGAVVAAACGAIVKVILETCLLNDDEIVRACRLAVQAGASFVKTSTGFGSGGATVHDVALMRQTVGPEIGVKASGGIRTRADAVNMIEAGASRIGTSAGAAICREEK